jgi:hypothetical protein
MHRFLVDLSDALERAKSNIVCRANNSSPPSLAFRRLYGAEPSEISEAKFIGLFEGCWAAFVSNLFRQLGTTATPDSIRAMDAEAREEASRAYDKAYQDAMAERIGGFTRMATTETPRAGEP